MWQRCSLMSNYYYHSLLLLLSFTVTHQMLTGNTVSDLTWSHIVSTTTTLHPFNGLFSRTTWVSRYKIGKNSLDLNEARWGFGMQWHQLDHMQTIGTSLKTDNHTDTPSLNFYRPDALPGAQSTVLNHKVTVR